MSDREQVVWNFVITSFDRDVAHVGRGFAGFTKHSSGEAALGLSALADDLTNIGAGGLGQTITRFARLRHGVALEVRDPFDGAKSVFEVRGPDAGQFREALIEAFPEANEVDRIGPPYRRRHEGEPPNTPLSMEGGVAIYEGTKRVRPRKGGIIAAEGRIAVLERRGFGSKQQVVSIPVSGVDFVLADRETQSVDIAFHDEAGRDLQASYWPGRGAPPAWQHALELRHWIADEIR